MVKKVMFVKFNFLVTKLKINIINKKKSYHEYL